MAEISPKEISRLSSALGLAVEALEDARQALIAAMDAIGGDENLEDTGDDESSLGGPCGDDREDDPAEMGFGDWDGLQMEAEPSLGSTHDIDQERAWQGPDSRGWFVTDGEPTFTTSEMEDATGRYLPASDDYLEPYIAGSPEEREHDDSESGIADRDGEVEQMGGAV